MATIAELSVLLGLDTKEFDKGVKDAEKKSGGLRKTLGTVGKAAGLLGGAAAAAGAGMFAMANQVTETGDRIHKASQRMGISTDALQEMEYWASQNGISQQSLERIVGRLNQRMGMAANGNEKYAEAMERLGISVDDVRNGTITTEEAFAKSIQTLSQMTNEHEKAELATEMFGTKMARDLLPALNDGSLSLEEAAQKARELGMVMDEDAVNASAQFQDTLDTLKRTMGGVFRDIAMQFLPALTALFDWIHENMPTFQAIFETVFSAVSGFVQTFIGWIGRAIDMVKEWFTSNEEDLTNIRDTFLEYVGQIREFIQSALERIREFWQNHGDQIMGIVDTIFSTIRNIVEMIVGDIVPFIQKQLERIREFWDENGEQIMEAVENAFVFIQGVIEFVMPIIQKVIEEVWGVIQQVFDTAIGIIMGLVETFSGLLTGDFEQMKDGLIRIWENLWNLIKRVLEGVWNLIRPVFRSLWENIKDWFIGLKNDALEWGRNMIDGFIQGIKDKVSAAGQAARDVVSGVGDFLRFRSPAKKGEGRFIEDWGANMIDGFLDGIRSALPDVQSMMSQVIPDMSAQFTPAMAAQGASHTENVITNQFTFTGPVNMRDENDIKLLARELNDLQQGRGRSEGDV